MSGAASTQELKRMLAKSQTSPGAAIQLLRSQRFHWIDSSRAASRQIACKGSRGGQDDRHCAGRQGIERADAEQQRFHESHEYGSRSEANDDANSSQHEGRANEHPSQ